MSRQPSSRHFWTDFIRWSFEQTNISNLEFRCFCLCVHAYKWVCTSECVHVSAYMWVCTCESSRVCVRVVLCASLSSCLWSPPGGAKDLCLLNEALWEATTGPLLINALVCVCVCVSLCSKCDYTLCGFVLLLTYFCWSWTKQRHFTSSGSRLLYI